ncbi:lysylphosphatidylglycerol synthase transmembrane domain-containing protein [Pedobacter sp. Leaf170]|uniref:lysylphosphatidylglycerol synthase transmembrane domain-containing protein n=1 Tax=Pedobacter sp. Leaf170 TaxID=2876558 RepID=UPI001E484286|nr:lysylphosphatidylglycerol synthase transmembrane domain-containing protein [Pedobacter sp. Leaf170]
MILDLKTALKYIILFLIGVGVLYLAFKGQDLAKIWQEIKTANIFWIFISAFTVWIANFLRALRWQMLFQSIDYKVTLKNAYHSLMIGYLANLAIPRFGEIGRCSIISKTHSVPMFSSIGTVITERLFDILALFLSALIVLIFQYNLISNFLHENIYQSIANRISSLNYFWIIVTALAFILVVIVLIYFLRQKFNTKFLKIIVGLRQGFSSYGKLQQKALFLFYTIAIWLCYFVSMYACFFALEETSTLPVNAAFTAMVFSGFAMVAPVQGGIGVFHWMVAQSLVLYNLPFKDGLAYATIIHSSQLLLTLLLGTLSLLAVFMVKRNTPEER